jgi:hypothetical protein
MAARRSDRGPDGGARVRTKKAAPSGAPEKSKPAKSTKAAKPTKAAKAAKATKPTKSRRRPVIKTPATVEGPPKAELEVRGQVVDAEQDPAATAKLALGPDARERERPATIPWSYGVDRVTAAAVDPDRLFVYWEVTDPAMERARAALGPGGAGAWLVLRVYDTSGLIFDGTNAHGYFDHPVDRATRQWFFDIGKPTSTAFVELGMKSTEGFFAKIVRSGRVDFPRREPAPWRDPEWMTVRPWSGEIAEVHPGPWGTRGGGGPPPEPSPHGFEPIPLWTLRDPHAVHEVVLRQLLESGWERVEWSEVSGADGFALEGRIEWESPRVVTSWEAGPFTYPVELEPPRREEWEGRGYAYRAGGVTHVVQGPWHVVIRGLGARHEHERLGAWEIHRSWTVHGGLELRVGSRGVVHRVGGSEQVAAQGASERSWSSGSEVRMKGASERFRIGASEVAFRGATETLFAGASQALLRGASERAYAGASESRLGGASERSLPGGSEGRLGGSEHRLGDGSAPPLPYPPIDPERSGREG